MAGTRVGATVNDGTTDPTRSALLADGSPPIGAAAAPETSPGLSTSPGRSEPASDALPNGPTSSVHHFKLGNRPPLTGIRALALVLVLTYHSNFRTLPGAWTALGVFFVLSGFLITATLSGEGQRTGRVGLKRFYFRRGLRLVPPLLLTVALLAIYAAIVPVGDASQRIWGDSAATLFYYADYRQALGHEPFFGYLAQCWSLSIEEQFYVVWSLLVVAAVAVGKRRLAYAFCLAGLFASIADRLWLIYRAPHFDTQVFTRIYYGFDTRADALFVGCLLGLIASDGLLHRWNRWATHLLGVLAIAAAGVLLWSSWRVPLFTRDLVLWWLPITELASAVLLAYFVISPRGVGSRFAGFWLFVYVGDLSYTVYLVHFPVYVALQPANLHWSFWPTELLRLAIIFGIAMLSWHLIEKPLMRRYRRPLTS